MTQEDILNLKIEAALIERDKKIDICNAYQRVLNAQRQMIYEEYEEKLQQLKMKLASLNDRSCKNLHPQQFFQ